MRGRCPEARRSTRNFTRMTPARCPARRTRAQRPTCLCSIGQIVAQARVLPQLPPAEVQNPRAHGILQNPVQAAGRVGLLLVLVLARSGAPVRSAGVVVALQSRDSSHTSLTGRHFRKKRNYSLNNNSAQRQFLRPCAFGGAYPGRTLGGGLLLLLVITLVMWWVWWPF